MLTVIASTVGLALLATAVLTAPPPLSNRLPRPRAPRRLPGAVITTAAVTVATLGVATVSPALAVAAVLLGSTGARRYRRRRRASRRRRERQLVAAALEIVVGELRSGAHPVDALTAAVSESEGAVAGTLSTVAALARYGADVGVGIREAARTSAVPDCWERVAVCWSLAAEHGLAMATLIAAAQHDIISRQRYSDALHAGLSGARATAGILAAMPVIGVLLGALIGAHPVAFLLSGPPGAVLLELGVALMCAGVIWSDRIIDRAAP